MNKLPQKNADLAVKGFSDFIAGRTADVKFRVFLCGAALDEKKTLEDQVPTDLRAYLWQRLEKELNCQVFLGEHNKLIEAYHRKIDFAKPKDLSKANLTLFEISLADYSDLIVIFPDSPGSYAELGMFSLAQLICVKLLVISKTKYKKQKSFINRGPVLAALGNRAKVLYEDYDNRQRIFEIVQDEVATLRQSLAAQQTMSRFRAK